MGDEYDDSRNSSSTTTTSTSTCSDDGDPQDNLGWSFKEENYY